ncbi:plasmid mobilization relaxosome protein MobC [Streptomyces sp. L7]
MPPPPASRRPPPSALNPCQRKNASTCATAPMRRPRSSPGAPVLGHRRRPLTSASSPWPHLHGELALPGQRTPLDDYIDELTALRSEVARIGYNINQITKKLNSGGHPHPGDNAHAGPGRTHLGRGRRHRPPHRVRREPSSVAQGPPDDREDQQRHGHRGSIRYLFDTKKAKDHTDPHLVASWDDFAPDFPGRADDFDATRKLLVADPRPARQTGLATGPRPREAHVALRSRSGPPESDRHLSDEEWADIARRVVGNRHPHPRVIRTACRWVAVRHAPDHIHIAATRVRADLRTARQHWNDYLTADRESRRHREGIRPLPSCPR